MGLQRVGCLWVTYTFTLKLKCNSKVTWVLRFQRAIQRDVMKPHTSREGSLCYCKLRLLPDTLIQKLLPQCLGLYILNWRILRFTVFFFSSASLNLLFIHFSEFYTLYIWFIYLCPGIKLLEVYCTQGKSGSLRRAPPLRPRRRFLCKMKAISKQWKACAFRKWAKQRWAVRKHHLLLGAGQDCGGPV